MIWIYDIESYSNFFSVTFKCIKTQEVKTFVIHETRNDLNELYQFIGANDGKWLVGYNSYNYDNQLLNAIYKYHPRYIFSEATEVAQSLFKLSQLIIENDYNDLRYNMPFPWLDLMKIGFYKKSLKLIGVALKWPKLQDLPIPPTEEISSDKIDLILKYNLNDVLITEQLFYHLEDNIKLRFDLSKRYNVKAHSESDSGVANRLLEKFYSEASGLPYSAFRSLRTERRFIKFEWVVFDYIHFQTDSLNELLEHVMNFNYYKGQAPYTKKVTFDGITYKLGAGGIHSVDRPALFEETTDNYLIDADIGSMYPSTVILNQLTPAHLGSKFLKNFTDLRDTRIAAKKAKDMTPAEGLKIVLNSAVGKTLNENHWLYDPLVNLQVTINGQLLILMLIEKLSLAGFHSISANTDGVTTIVPKVRVDEYYKICKQWEHETRYELEYAYYKKYARRDVNNYIAIKEDGVKTKGLFIHEFPSKFSNMTDPLNKGWDKPIVSKALYEFFVNNTPIETTIKQHTDIYDFCIAKKIDKKFTNEFQFIKNGQFQVEQLQQSVRYYISKTGGSLLKVDKDGSKENYESKQVVTIFNDYVEKGMDDYNINYPYYITQTQKVLNEIINPQLKLF